MMHDLLPWMLSIGKYILASVALLAFYRLFFRKYARYSESRVFLLSVALFAVLVSQFRIQVTHPAPTIVEVEQVVLPAPEWLGMTIPSRSTPALADLGVAKTMKSTKTIASTWGDRLRAKPEMLLFVVYGLVAIVLMLIELYQFRSIRRLRRKGKVSHHAGYDLVVHEEVSTPFSFAKTIFLPANLNENQREVVVTHELWHIRHKHYVDVLLQELLSCLFWFNPIQWILRKDLRSVHEFQADRSVLSEGYDLYRYQTIILEEVMGNHFRLANGFNQSFTKKRFIQMKNQEPSRLTSARKILFIPFLTILFAALSFVPGKSQVITVEKKSTTINQAGQKVTTTTSFKMDSVPKVDINSLKIDPSNIQKSFNLQLDTLQYMADKTLPILRRLSRSTNKTASAQDINTLLSALKVQANGQSIRYESFSAEVQKSINRQDFEELENVMAGIQDTVRMLRTKKVDRMDSPYLIYPLTMMQGFMKSSFFNKIFPELFRLIREMMGQMMGTMTEALGASSVVCDSASLSSSMSQLGTTMQQLSSNLGSAFSEKETPTGVVGSEQVSTVYDDQHLDAHLFKWRNDYISCYIHSIERKADVTLVTLAVPVKDPYNWIRFSSGFQMTDLSTGDKYMIRKVDHIPMNETIYFPEVKNKMLLAVLSFPPLKERVKYIDLVEYLDNPSGDGGEIGWIFRNVSLSNVAPEKVKEEKSVNIYY